MIHERTLQALEFPKVLEHLAHECLSGAGRDAALALRPFTTVKEVLHSVRLFEQYRVWAEIAAAGEKSFHMEAFPDVRGVLLQAEKSHPRPDLEDFWGLRAVLRLAARAVASLHQNDAVQQWPDLLMLSEAAPLPRQLTAALNRCLSDDGNLKDESSPELYQARTELRRLHQSCMHKVKDFAIQYNMLSYLQDEFMTLASDRYVLPLKANFKGRMQGIIHDWSQTGETCYFEPMFLVEINNRLQELKRQEREEELKVMKYLTGLFLSETDGVHNAFDLLRTLDILSAKTRLAGRYDGRCISITGLAVQNSAPAQNPDATGAGELPDAPGSAGEYSLSDQHVIEKAQDGGKSAATQISSGEKSTAIQVSAHVREAEGHGEAYVETARPSPYTARPLTEKPLSEGQSAEKLPAENGPAKEHAGAALPPAEKLLAEGHGEAVVSLLRTRHPLLALAALAAKKPLESVHPLDIILRNHERGLIISGGNAGGKTVCLKTLGLVAAMAFTGLPVPAAAGSTLPFWQRIDAFIGDEQSLDDHVSTFTAQIQHLAKAWKHTGSGSLVLLDEFGAGTDPAQGAALAQAVLDELLERDTYVLAATHFPALKAYALTREKARAASVLFDPGTKKPLFRLAYDQVGASQALDVAREHGLPEAILRRAEHYLLLDGGDAGAVMTRLNSLAVEREKELAALREELDKQKRRKEQLNQKFEKERQTLYTEVRSKAADLMRAWKEGKATHKQALKEMSRLRAGLAEPAAPAEPGGLKLPELAVGQTVRHRTFGKRAVIMDIDERRNKVRIDMNGVSLWAAITDLQAQELPASRPGGTTARVSGGESSSFTLDLRGKRADIALYEVEQFLDKALLAGFETVEIVHGRGTGVLRREIHNFLRTFPAVKDFALAPEDRGGDGMTIVTLR